MNQAAEFGIEDTPTYVRVYFVQCLMFNLIIIDYRLIYFENTIPSIYSGDLTKEDKVLAWLIGNLYNI
jgi:hypothetical protein